jgi:hypothetical protein
LKQATRVGADATIRQLTEGIALPLPPLHPLHIEVICNGLLHIWRRLVEMEPEAVAVSDEPGLNSVLVSAINRQLALDDPALIGFAMLVQRAESGVQTPNYLGNRLELRPDISLPLKAGKADFLHPLVVECKILDRAERKTVGLYCDRGLIQFVNGDYGWARQDGFMLAYVRDGSTIAQSLTPFLHKSLGNETDQFATQRLPKPIGQRTDQAESTHDRAFRYVGKAANDCPGTIAVRHIWVDAQRPSGL